MSSLAPFVESGHVESAADQIDGTAGNPRLRRARHLGAARSPFGGISDLDIWSPDIWSPPEQPPRLPQCGSASATTVQRLAASSSIASEWPVAMIWLPVSATTSLMTRNV